MRRINSFVIEKEHNLFLHVSSSNLTKENIDENVDECGHDALFEHGPGGRGPSPIGGRRGRIGVEQGFH